MFKCQKCQKKYADRLKHTIKLKTPLFKKEVILCAGCFIKVDFKLREVLFHHKKELKYQSQ